MPNYITSQGIEGKRKSFPNGVTSAEITITKSTEYVTKALNVAVVKSDPPCFPANYVLLPSTLIRTSARAFR
jgi:hypothetical protein